MLWRTECLIIDNMDFRIGQVHEVYENMFALFVGIERDLIVVLPQAQAT